MVVAIAFLLLILYPILGYKKPGVAVITAPVVCILFSFGVVLIEEPVLIWFAPLIFFGTLVAILLSRREGEGESWPQFAAKLILWICLGLLAVITAFAALGPAGIFGLILFVIFIGSIISFGLTSQHSTAAYVISTIGASMRQNLPLPMALESAASGRADKRALILRAIQKWLVQGYSLSESIKRGYPKCPGHAVAMMAAAERVGQLPFAIKSIEADMAARADESKKVRPIHPLYPVVLLVFVVLVLLAMMTFVLPKFVIVLEEMMEGQPLPAATRVLVELVHGVVYDYGGWVIFSILLVIGVPVGFRARFRPRRPGKPYLISRAADFMKWSLPILHWFERNYSLVQVVEYLRLSLNAGCTVNAAIANTLGLDVNNRFKLRLREWLARVEAGQGIAEAARESKLGGTLAWAFDEKINQGNTLAILDTLESFYRSNYGYRVNLARFILWPCVTIVMGGVVGFVVYALYSPMIAVINSAAGFVLP